MEPFEQATYLAQVRRLRQLGKRALALYPLRVKDCSFVNHGENTTFQITAGNDRKFLLRIHRPGYHTESAILEELHWLEILSNEQMLLVPTPYRSKNGKLVERAATDAVNQQRLCCLFEWIDGRFMYKSLTPIHMNQLGKIIGRIQKSLSSAEVVHRRYWDAEGLLGKNAKFGSVDSLSGISAGDQKIVSKGRRLVFRTLQRFQDDFPQKQGIIHADLHFGNILVAQRRLAVIDFDDCGFGFYAYDLAVPLISIGHMLGIKRKREIPKFKQALIDGYATEARWDEDDEAILRHLISARKLVMLGWLNSRSDNPLLRKHLRRAVAKAVQHLQKEYDLNERW